MKLYYTGHDYRYACEQSLLVLFPTERPEYSEEQVKENAAYLSLHYGKTWVTASCRIYRDGVFDGTSRVRKDQLTDELSVHRLLPKILRLAFYRAAERCTGKSLAWGALTGVRPAKLATRMLEEGLSAKSAVSRMKKDFFVSLTLSRKNNRLSSKNTPELYSKYTVQICKSSGQLSLPAVGFGSSERGRGLVTIYSAVTSLPPLSARP